MNDIPDVSPYKISRLPPPGISGIPDRSLRRRKRNVLPCPHCGRKNRWRLRAWTEDDPRAPFVFHSAWIECTACSFAQGVNFCSPGHLWPSLEDAVERVFEVWNALPRPFHEV